MTTDNDEYEPEPRSQTASASSLLPYLGLVLIFSVALSLAIFKYAGGYIAPRSTTGTMVSFDVVKFINAQKAVASAFVSQDANSDKSEANLVFYKLSERTRATIAEIAGPGTVVVLKQSVIQGPVEDITDSVLKELGLPIDVPTVDGAKYSIDIAPTMLRLPTEGKDALSRIAEERAIKQGEPASSVVP